MSQVQSSKVSALVAQYPLLKMKLLQYQEDRALHWLTQMKLCDGSMDASRGVSGGFDYQEGQALHGLTQGYLCDRGMHVNREVSGR